MQVKNDMARRQTTPYEPLYPDWGVNGAAANGLEVCMPSPPPQPMNRTVTSCTRCYCELERPTANDDAAREAVCVLCGTYKAKRVSTQFLFISQLSQNLSSDAIPG